MSQRVLEIKAAYWNLDSAASQPHMGVDRSDASFCVLLPVTVTF